MGVNRRDLVKGEIMLTSKNFVAMGESARPHDGRVEAVEQRVELKTGSDINVRPDASRAIPSLENDNLKSMRNSVPAFMSINAPK
jgi:hypothetical protein